MKINLEDPEIKMHVDAIMDGYHESGKRAMWHTYVRARKILEYNESFRRPGQSFFIKRGRERVAGIEKAFPDFKAAYNREHL